MGLRRLLATAGLLALPPIGLGYALEKAVRSNAFKTGPYQRGVPEATTVPFEHARFWTADGQAAGPFSNASAPLQLGAEVGQKGFDLF